MKMTAPAWLSGVTQSLHSQPSYSTCSGMKGIILPPFFQQAAYQIITSALFWVTQGQETIFFAPSQVFGYYWHSLLGLEQGVVPGYPEGRAETAWLCCSSWHRFCFHLTSCAISFLTAAPQACQRVGGREGEGGKLW